VTHTNQYAEAGTYLRVHVHPKRSPRCYEIDWKSRIVAVTDSYVILDKPAGTTVGGTTDNIEESCATFASRALDLPEPLKTTHQIDNCTEGCVVFARTKEYCSVFHTKIRNKEVKKLYRALAAAPLPIGIISHYMRPKNMAPRLVAEDSIQGWHLCQLEVLECKKIPWPDAATEKKHDIEDCGWTSKEFAYECTINLLTGKTHQVCSSTHILIDMIII
jgi:23S rRNA-/tRNA-specific pseudouridylate synthase